MKNLAKSEKKQPKNTTTECGASSSSFYCGIDWHFACFRFFFRLSCEQTPVRPIQKEREHFGVCSKNAGHIAFLAGSWMQMFVNLYVLRDKKIEYVEMGIEHQSECIFTNTNAWNQVTRARFFFFLFFGLKTLNAWNMLDLCACACVCAYNKIPKRNVNTSVFWHIANRFTAMKNFIHTLWHMNNDDNNGRPILRQKRKTAKIILPTQGHLNWMLRRFVYSFFFCSFSHHFLLLLFLI